MHAHVSSCLEGPINKSRDRWLAEAAVSAENEVRTDLVERVRREIASGSYDTPEKWELTLDRLLDRLEQA